MFVSVPTILVTPLTCEVPPVKPLPVGAAQVYVVPAGTMPLLPFTGLTVNGELLNTVDVIALITATGLTVMIALNVLPVQVPDVGVIV